MSDEAEGRQVAEEVETGEKDDAESQHLEDRGGEGGGDGSPVTVDTAVAAFFSAEGGGSEKGGVASGKSDDVRIQDRMVVEEWSSDDEKEARAQPPDTGTDKTAEELPVHAASDSARKSPEDEQQAMAEAEAVSLAEAEREDGEEELGDVDPAQSAGTAEQKRDSDDHHVETPDDSAEEDGADGEGDERAQERLSAMATPPAAEAAATPPIDNNQITDQDEDRKDGKVNDAQDQTEDPRLELGSDQRFEPGDMNAVGGDLTGPGEGRQEGVHMVAQDLVQHVLDRVMMAETNGPQATAAGQETDIKTFAELDRVDLNSEDWGSEGLGRTSPPPDDASLSDTDMDREQDADRLPSDSEQLPEGDGDLRDAETGSSDYVLPCDGERELQGESQQMYQYASDDHSRSAASSPCSQVSDGIQDTGDKPSVPAAAHMSGEAGSPRDRSPPPGRSLPQQHSIRSTTQDQPSARDPVDRSRGEAEESYDGSYLWLQRQTQWRAGSSEVPVVRGSRESGKVDRHTTSPSSGYHMLSRGDNSGSRQDVLAGEGRLGVSALSTSSDLSGSVTSPGAIPNFNTLRDQQVSWLSMYRMLEEQHRSELKAQYQEHQHMIHDMQRQLEGELLSQQNTMRQKLDSHRQALKETSSYEYSRNQGSSSSWYNKHSPQGGRERDTLPPSDHSSPSQHRDAYSKDATARSSRDSLRSPPEISREKRLRGGVYSSPMPTAKFRSSARERYSYEEDSQEPSYTSERRSQRQEKELESDSRPPSGQILSPRTHQSLREKHAKHLTDLRSYYEAEVQDLRQKLSAEGLRPLSISSSSAAAALRDSTRERLLQEENQVLRLQLRDLQDSVDDAQIYSRDLEQKIQGLEIRAGDYAKRYEESQSTVLKLKNRLEELHSYAKDRESVVEQAQANERRQAATLQDLFKAKEDLEETARRDNSTIKRLLDKYEMMEKDYTALKDTSADFEQKLFETRTETVQLNKVISQMELENKRLTHDNNNMRHRLAISGSLPLTRQELAETGQRRGGYENLNGHSYDSQGLSHSQNSARSRDATPPPRNRGLSDDEDSASLGKSDSPLLRAERELRRLQQTLDHGEFIPRLQPKKYTSSGSLCPASGEVTIIDAFSSHTRSSSGTSVDAGPKEGTRRVKKPVSGPPAKRERPIGAQSKQTGAARSPQKSNMNGDSASSIASPTRFDVGVPPTGVRSPVAATNKGGRSREGKQDPKPAAKSVSKSSSEDARRVDATLERIRSGEFVARPQWEDVYTSLAKPAQPDKTSTINMTQEEMLRDRIRSIDQMERRYDTLQVEKRKLESQLNKVPAHGRDRKSRREKELLEETLDNVDHELGSLRMTLKRYQVLKTTM